MTGHILPGGRDGENSPRRDVWVGGGGGSKQEEAGGCPFAIPRAVAITAVLVTVAASTLLRRSLVRFRLLLSTAAATVVAVLLFGTAASAVAVQPRPNDGFWAMTVRACGTSAGWQANANRNGVTGAPWTVYLGRTYQIECAGAVPAQPAVAGNASIWTWTHPAPGRCVTGGYRTAARPNHRGVDMSMPVGTNVLAAAAGVVSWGNDPGGAGWYMVVAHAGGGWSLYFHLSNRLVPAGNRVVAGQHIAESGGARGSAGAGNSSGPHLHLEIHVNALWSNRVDPVPFMANRGVRISC